MKCCEKEMMVVEGSYDDTLGTLRKYCTICERELEVAQ